ncbi:MAG: hypothetical protein QW035_03590 [Candidatus Anstonellales archaeon]
MDEEEKADYSKISRKFKEVADSNARLDLIKAIKLYSQGSKDESLKLLSSIIEEAPSIAASMLYSPKSELADEFSKLRFFSIFFAMLKSVKRYDAIVATILFSFRDKKHYPIELVTTILPFMQDKEFISEFSSSLEEHPRELLQFLVDSEEQEFVKPFRKFIKDYIEENFGDDQYTAIKAISLIKDSATERFLLGYIDDWDEEVRRLVLLYFMNSQSHEIGSEFVNALISEKDRRLRALLKHIIMNNFSRLKDHIIKEIKKNKLEASKDLLHVAFMMMDKKELSELADELSDEKRNYLLNKMYI